MFVRCKCNENSDSKAKDFLAANKDSPLQNVFHFSSVICTKCSSNVYYFCESDIDREYMAGIVRAVKAANLMIDQKKGEPFHQKITIKDPFTGPVMSLVRNWTST